MGNFIYNRSVDESEGFFKENYIIEGYAAVFNKPTILFIKNGIEYKEQIDRHAFDNCIMDDVFLKFNHEGEAFARTINETLIIKIDDIGLWFRADLSKTEDGQKMYNKIKLKFFNKASFAFSVADEKKDIDVVSEQNLEIVKHIYRLYDLSVVDIPAYDDTTISCRSLYKICKEKETQIIKKIKIINILLGV